MRDSDLDRPISVHDLASTLRSYPRAHRHSFHHNSVQARQPNAAGVLGYRPRYLSATEMCWLEKARDRAAETQRQLLPDEHMHFVGWEISYCYQPLGPLGGDYCDIIICGSPEKELLLLVGDACGKGVAASLLMAQVHAIFRSLGSASLPIKELVEWAGRICASTPFVLSYATVLCVRATSEGDIETCKGGHCSPLLVGQAGVMQIESGGVPLGLFPKLVLRGDPKAPYEG